MSSEGLQAPDVVAGVEERLEVGPGLFAALIAVAPDRGPLDGVARPLALAMAARDLQDGSGPGEVPVDLLPHRPGRSFRWTSGLPLAGHRVGGGATARRIHAVKPADAACLDERGQAVRRRAVAGPPGFGAAHPGTRRRSPGAARAWRRQQRQCGGPARAGRPDQAFRRRPSIRPDILDLPSCEQARTLRVPIGRELSRRSGDNRLHGRRGRRPAHGHAFTIQRPAG